MYKGAHFHEDWPYRTEVMTISLDTENSKWWISEKKSPKTTQIYPRNLIELRKKNFALLFLIRRSI